ncbi:MAG TPA: hypothetical protein VGM39_15180 [Kofleriaceae bacterium]|jgi:hypothetical protein
MSNKVVRRLRKLRRHAERHLERVDADADSTAAELSIFGRFLARRWHHAWARIDSLFARFARKPTRRRERLLVAPR